MVVRDSDGSKKASKNIPKKAKMGGRGTGRGRVIKLNSHGSRGYSN
jgi:hypothetical protein